MPNDRKPGPKRKKLAIIFDDKTRRYHVFFQAEDGIRDAQESRGLGDVYKRQV